MGDLSLNSVVCVSNSALNHGATIIWHTVRMQDESPLTLRQADQLRTDIANVESGLEVIT